MTTRPQGTTSAPYPSSHVRRRVAVCLAAALLSACGNSRERTLHRLDANLAQGNYRAAIIDAQTLIHSDPNNVGFRIRYVDALLPGRRFADAAAELHRAEQLGASPAEVAPRLLEALVGQRDFAGALALGLDPALLQQPKVMRLRGEALLGSGRNDEARQLLTQVIARTPRDARAHLDLASLYSRLADPAGVKSELDQALAVGADDYVVQAAIGGWNTRSGNLPGAREHIAKAAAIARRENDRGAESTALINLADVALAQGDAAAAKSSLERLRQLIPGTEPALVLEARLALHDAHPLEAATALEKVLSKNPQSAIGNLLLGTIKAQQGYLEQAQSYLSAAIASSPNDPRIRKLLAEVELRQGEAHDVLGLVGEASTSKDSELLSLGGRASLSAGDPATAIEYFERSHEAAGSDSSRTLELAQAYIAANRGGDAVSLLRKTSVPTELANRYELLLTVAMAQSGQRSAAIAEAGDFAKSHPDDASALVAAGRGLWAAGEPAGARELLVQATQLNPKDRGAWSALGTLALSQGDTDGATRSFDAVLRLQPDDVDAFIGKARIALRSGKKDEAVRQLEAARRAQPTALAPSLDLARLYLAGNDQPHLTEALKDLRQIAPQSMQVRALEADRALAQHEIPAAIAAYSALSSDFPAVAPFHARLAQAYLLAGRLTEARQANLDALKLDPGYAAGDVFEAGVAMQQNLLPEAAQAIEQLRARPGVSPALVAVLQGDLQMRKSDFAAATRYYAASYAALPSSAAALREYAALRAAHSPARQDSLRDWLGRSPDDVRVRLTLAQDLQSAGDAKGAEQQYTLLLQSHPDNVLALNNLAVLRVNAGASEEALTFARRAYEHDSHSAAVADTYGWALLQSNKVPEALPVLRAAHSAAPEEPEIRYHLAVALVKSDRQPEAQQELEAIVGSGSHFPEQDAARSLLKSLTAPRS